MRSCAHSCGTQHQPEKSDAEIGWHRIAALRGRDDAGGSLGFTPWTADRGSLHGANHPEKAVITAATDATSDQGGASFSASICVLAPGGKCAERPGTRPSTLTPSPR